ncbi:MAG: hypothetical protein JRG80_09060 [Deltaproteobacteria bacterium]|nr:hypothetical protein [Deltaproteobacteria bacterium]
MPSSHLRTNQGPPVEVDGFRAVLVDDGAQLCADFVESVVGRQLAPAVTVALARAQDSVRVMDAFRLGASLRAGVAL